MRPELAEGHSIIVVALSLPDGSPRSNGSISSSHTPSKGSGRVRHRRSVLVSDGTGPICHFRADRTLIPAMAAAVVISVLYRGCAIPVAWSIHRATQKSSWTDPTVALLRELAPAVPKGMTVIVLCDRGISSPKLWKQIRAQGWHPCMRYRNNVTFCADDGKRLPARRFVSVPDTAWIGRGTAFGTPAAQRRCTLLVVWYAEQEEPWIILTDLVPEEVGV